VVVYALVNEEESNTSQQHNMGMWQYVNVKL